VQLLETKARFAHLALGRECVQTGYIPPGAEREIAEIRQMAQRKSESWRKLMVRGNPSTRQMEARSDRLV